ncbi:Hypothetical protein CINCED_3A002850 [Cinara cedri]|uniref:Uncharacterized protein n=1 Tax=Cinara cedri TaxID=506608 RepID=A0A5E4MUE3_9HEMI|nr:Hypothetical protein CINCED_3A002850 [Cinara cedri]
MRRSKKNKIVIFLCLMLLALFHANQAYPSSADNDPSKYQQPTEGHNSNDDDGWEQGGVLKTPEPIFSCFATCKMQCLVWQHMGKWRCDQYWSILYTCMCHKEHEKH